MNRLNTEAVAKITGLYPASCRYLCKKGVLGSEVKGEKRALLYYSPFKIARFLGIQMEDMTRIMKEVGVCSE